MMLTIDQVQKAAEKAGQPAQEFCDSNAEIFRTLANTANISYDYFARTSDHQHKSAVQSAWVGDNRTFLEHEELSSHCGAAGFTQR